MLRPFFPFSSSTARALNIIFITCIGLIVSLNLSASDPLADFKKAGEHYQKQDYENAIQLYENLIRTGHVATEVYYNLGNCYFKTGNVARAILNYERARKLSPDDDDINFNIKIASLKVVDKMEAVPEIFYKRWLKLMASELSPDNWSKILLGSAWLLFIFLGVYLVASSAPMKKFGFVLVLVFIVLTGVFFAFAQKSYAMTFLDKQAIITSASVYVKSSPDEKGSDQFIIHEGTKVDVLDELNDWQKIRIANGSIGWLKQNEIEII